jgi:hypothetical protein
MSNNQKAVKNNPSNSKNVIGIALLRYRTKVFANYQNNAFSVPGAQNRGSQITYLTRHRFQD